MTSQFNVTASEAKGGQLAELKAVYNHSTLGMTFEYIGLSDLDALNAFANRIAS